MAHRNTVKSEGKPQWGLERSRKERRRQAPAARDVPREEIAARAYERYRSRGGENGHDLDDWLEAEREVGAEGAVLPLGTRLALGAVRLCLIVGGLACERAPAVYQAEQTDRDERS